jgi:predicted permease
MPSLRLALRTLARTPLVTTVAVASLALGIGANTAIFSLVQRVLLRPLPVPEPDRLVNVLASGPNPGSQSCNRAGSCRVVFSYPMFRDLERGQTALTGLAGHRPVSADVAFRGRSLAGGGAAVSGSYFPVLGLRPALGRLLGPDDDRTPGGHPVAVLAHRYWVNELGSDSTVLGQAILVNGHPMTIVGVAPPGFEGTTLGVQPRVFVPLTMRVHLEPWGAGAFEDRRSYWVYAFGRLRPGVSPGQAADQLNAVYRPIIVDVELPLQVGQSPQRLEEFRRKQVRVEPGPQGQSSLMAETRAPLLLLLAVTGIVLLVACTNVANLLLARAAARASEMAVRSSLGASRSHLVGQLLTEAGVLALAAGGASLVVARATLGLLGALMPGELGSTLSAGLSLPVLGFAAAVSLGTVLLFGLLPALQATRPDLLTVTKAAPGRTGAGRGAVRFRHGLVTAQIALSMALLCAAGLFLRSLANVNRVELGLEPERVVTFAVAPQQIGYDSLRTWALFERLREELAALPGTVDVATGLVPLVRGWSNGNDVDVDGFPTTPEADVNARSNYVGTGYFRTLGIPVLAGREFGPGDGPGTPGVAVVNEAFARKFRLGNPVGHRLRLGNALTRQPGSPPPPDLEIVGLVRDAAYSEVKDTVPPVLFLAARQAMGLGRLSFYVRTRGEPEPVVRAIEPLVARLEPMLPVAELRTLPQQIRENVYLDRLLTTLSAGFALVATLLAAVGLYGVLAYTIAQRTREIGLRMALGADAGRVRRMVLRQVGVMTLAGMAAGAVGAVGIGRAARSLLFGLPGVDAPAFLGAALLLALVAAGAGLVPAARAARVHPMEALRAE